VASILAEIGIDSSKFSSGSKGVMGGLKDMLGGFGKLLPGIGFVTAAFGMLVDQLNKAEQAAVESAKADAKLEAVLASTNYMAGMTAAQLDSLATSISKASGMDDELVKSAEAVMLTFTKISGDVFPATMQAASDMSAVLGQDLQGSVTMIGKAMNDFSGYTALKRAGVSFTEEQIKQIANFKATNDLVGYQELLLKELSTEYGGAAKAINDAGDGAENMKIAVGNLQEEIGEGLIPVKRSWNELITTIADNLSESIGKTNDYNESLKNLNIQWINGVGYIKDGERVTYDAVQAMVDAEQAARAESAAVKDVGESASLTTEQLQEMSDTNKGMVSLVEKFVDVTKLSAEEQEFATRKIVLGYLEQQLALDGLTNEEVDLLLKKGVEWGIYSDTAILAMQETMAEVNALTNSINGIPSSRNITITTNYVSQYTNGVSTQGHESHGNLGGYANGADFIVPAGYPNDSFPINVQSGEHVQVTPAGQSSDTELLAEMQGLRRAFSNLPRDMASAMGEKFMQMGLV
jgi:hypothetical protein